MSKAYRVAISFGFLITLLTSFGSAASLIYAIYISAGEDIARLIFCSICLFILAKISWYTVRYLMLSEPTPPYIQNSQV